MSSEGVSIQKRISLVFFVITAVIIILVSIMTYIHQDVTSANPVVFWAVNYHLPITIVLLFISAVAGYMLSSSIYHELRKSKRDSEKMLDMLFLFLHKEEKIIIRCLAENNGSCKQSEIARLPEMNSVKAFRSLQKMKEKDIIDISVHGKVRNISLKSHLRHVLVQHK